MDELKSYRRRVITKAKPMTKIEFYGAKICLGSSDAEKSGYYVKEIIKIAEWYSKEDFNRLFIEAKDN